MNKVAVNSIISTLGSRAICELLEVSRHAVRTAKTKGVFAASWYQVIDDACQSAGIPCPRDAFNWRVIAKKNSNDNTDIQGDDTFNAY